ncbi:MAG: lysophospholipid acyltransferase family protein [Hyphomicrobiaceae bacterium]
MKFPELTYATPSDHWLKRQTIQALERWAGRDYFVPLYERWQAEHVGGPGPVIRPMLELCDVEMRVVAGSLPTGLADGVPLVIVANHPFGIVDGIAALSIAEALGRPFRVIINKDLLKVPEIRPYSLAVDFTETRAAQADNIRMRNEALRLLKEGTTIVVFPAGGVATAPSMYERAAELPWKAFTARMILAARAQVLPVWFDGQCGPLFQLASRFSLTLRLGLIIRELRRHVGRPLHVRIGEPMPFAEIEARAGNDRRRVMQLLFERVHALSGEPIEDIRQRMAALPGWLKQA